MSDVRRRELHEADTALASASHSLSVEDWRAAEASIAQARAVYRSLGLGAMVAHCDELLGQLHQAAHRNADAVVAYGLARDAYLRLGIDGAVAECDARLLEVREATGSDRGGYPTKTEPRVPELWAW